jgi:hypothetical protein
MGNKIPPGTMPLASFAKGAKIAGDGANSASADAKTPVVGAICNTLFTRAGETRQIVASPPDGYLQVRLLLETTGQVCWGFLQALTPVASGKGRLLIQNLEQVIELPPATRLYIASDGSNRVGLTVVPIAYQAEILAATRKAVK